MRKTVSAVAFLFMLLALAFGDDTNEISDLNDLNETRNVAHR